MNLPVLFPGYWAMALLITRRGTDESLKDSQKKKNAFRTKMLNF